MPAKAWAEAEFGGAQLGDCRRSRRLTRMAERLAAQPGGRLPQAFPDWAELKAAYRFLDRKEATFERTLAPHLERVREFCRAPGEYLLIEDTTLLDYSGRKAGGLGRIGDGAGQGFELHTTLAARVEGWDEKERPEARLAGLFWQQCLAPRPAPPGEKTGQRLSRPRKSQRWAAALRAGGRPPEGARWIYVADRESDFYEPLQLCREHGVDFIIRACHDRRLAEGGHMREAVAAAPALGRSCVELRSRPGQAGRVAEVEVRAARVDLDGPWRPGGWQPPLPGVTVVEVRETAPPAEVKEPLRWLLLTSLPCQNAKEALRVAGRHCRRWWIEEYHKALKSGAGVESSQLREGFRLEPLIAILAVVAVRLLAMKLEARSQGAEAALGEEARLILERNYGLPSGGWTSQSLLVAVARLGSFLARKGDGQPGWQTIWRGWNKLFWMSQGLELLKSSPPPSG